MFITKQKFTGLTLLEKKDGVKMVIMVFIENSNLNQTTSFLVFLSGFF